MHRVVLAQGNPNLGDGSDEDQVEEKLQPRDAPGVNRVGRPKPNRSDEVDGRFPARGQPQEVIALEIRKERKFQFSEARFQFSCKFLALGGDNFRRRGLSRALVLDSMLRQYQEPARRASAVERGTVLFSRSLLRGRGLVRSP